MSNNYCRANSLPRIDSYALAAAEWEKTKPIRGRADTNKRPLGTLRAIDRFAIIKQGDSYALRYHNTDVITYHADGSITLDYWASKSTDEFANRLDGGAEDWVHLGKIINVEDKLRNAIYAAAGDVVTCTELPYLTGTGPWGVYSGVRKIRAVNAKWQYL